MFKPVETQIRGLVEWAARRDSDSQNEYGQTLAAKRAAAVAEARTAAGHGLEAEEYSKADSDTRHDLYAGELLASRQCHNDADDFAGFGFA
jgi:hypothetical protein